MGTLDVIEVTASSTKSDVNLDHPFGSVIKARGVLTVLISA